MSVVLSYRFTCDYCGDDQETEQSVLLVPPVLPLWWALTDDDHHVCDLCRQGFKRPPETTWPGIGRVKAIA